MNSAEPWARGKRLVRISIGRTVRVSRPSMRGSPDKIWLRTIFASMSNSMLSTLTESNTVPDAVSALFAAPRVASRSAWVRVCLERIW